MEFQQGNPKASRQDASDENSSIFESLGIQGLLVRLHERRLLLRNHSSGQSQFGEELIVSSRATMNHIFLRIEFLGRNLVQGRLELGPLFLPNLLLLGGCSDMP